MLPGLEMMAACTDIAVPAQVMRHVAAVESSHNPYAIGVVGGRLVRQPRNLAEAVSTARMLEGKGMNFSLGIAQVNRYNLAQYGLENYQAAFDVCSNVRAGARILAECYARSGDDWGKAFSCYYSGNFSTGFRHGYVQKVFASMARDEQYVTAAPIALSLASGQTHQTKAAAATGQPRPLLQQRIVGDDTAQRSRSGMAVSAQQARQHVYPVDGVAARADVPAAVQVASPMGVRLRGVDVKAATGTLAAQPVGTQVPLPIGAAQPARDSALVF